MFGKLFGKKAPARTNAVVRSTTPGPSPNKLEWLDSPEYAPLRLRIYDDGSADVSWREEESLIFGVKFKTEGAAREWLRCDEATPYRFTPPDWSFSDDEVDWVEE